MNTEKKIVTAGIIDDDEIFTYGFVKLSLKKGLFDEILAFADGKQAIDFLKDRGNMHRLPDVLFVDINMPVMDGWEFNAAFEEIRSQLGKNITLYNISSSVDLADIRRAQKNPIIQDYILKPIDEVYLADIASELRNPGELIKYN